MVLEFRFGSKSPILVRSNFGCARIMTSMKCFASPLLVWIIEVLVFFSSKSLWVGHMPRKLSLVVTERPFLTVRKVLEIFIPILVLFESRPLRFFLWWFQIIAYDFIDCWPYHVVSASLATVMIGVQSSLRFHHFSIGYRRVDVVVIVMICVVTWSRLLCLDDLARLRLCSPTLLILYLMLGIKIMWSTELRWILVLHHWLLITVKPSIPIAAATSSIQDIIDLRSTTSWPASPLIINTVIKPITVRFVPRIV